MNIALSAPMTLDQFLAWEERQELRYEFDGRRPIPMTGGTVAHDTIGNTLRALLHQQLKGKRCHVRGPTLKFEVMGHIRYPDAYVYCSAVEPTVSVISTPVVVFEVLSEETSRTDRIEKFREYQATPSIQRYVILEQDSIAATVFTRRATDWYVRVLIEQDTLYMPEIDVELPLPDIYVDTHLHSGDTEDQSFPPPPAR